MLKSTTKSKTAGLLMLLLALGLSGSLFPANAQILGLGEQGAGGCASGIFSNVDGSCIGDNQLNQQTAGSTAPGATSGQAAVPGMGAGALAQQYPGMQSAGALGRTPNFRMGAGLPVSLAEQRAALEEQALASAKPGPPTGFQLMTRASLGRMLPIYGDSLFRQAPWTFAPLWQTPVPSNYVIGPGDQLLIHIWGQINFNSEVTVDRSGAIYLPQVGQIHLAGLPYSQLHQHLADALSRVYKNFHLSVEMGKLRAIQVFVVGQARRPGSYTLSSLSTLVTAIFATGGPSVQGSLRDIQVRRDGQTVDHFDLYDLLLNGDKSKDIPLLSGDVIYIPPAGPQVAVGGSVRNPAIYELKGPTPIREILRMAGGLSPAASVLNATLDRVDAHQNRSSIGISLTGSGLSTDLRDGDILWVRRISPEYKNVVTLRGNVAEPGRFAWHAGMKLSEIIPNSQSLITRDYWERRNRLGIPGPEFLPEYATNPDFYTQQVQGGRLQVETGGAPGATPAATPGTTAGAGTGAAAGASSSSNTGIAVGVTSMNARAAGSSGSGASGAASAPGEPASPHGALPPPNPPLSVAMPVPAIDWSYAVIERMNPKTLANNLIPFNLGELVLHHNAGQDLTLEPGDVITIFSQADIQVPQAQQTKYVRLEGEFEHAGVYSLKPGETLRELVERAGGLTSAAYLYGSNFTRRSTRVVQQARLDDYVSQLELDIDRSTISTTASSLNPMDQAAATAEAAASRGLIAKFRSIKATGRIVLNIAPDAAGVASLPNLPLENGDAFVVPPRPDTVNVVGAVYDQNAFLYEPNGKVKGYLHLAGGASRNADPKHAFIIRADGSVVSRASRGNVFGNSFDSAVIYPGDTVVVPEKVPKLSTLRNINNLSQIFSQLAFGAAAIAVLR